MTVQIFSKENCDNVANYEKTNNNCSIWGAISAIMETYFLGKTVRGLDEKNLTCGFRGCH